jgi:hypothetical protein
MRYWFPDSFASNYNLVVVLVAVVLLLLSSTAAAGTKTARLVIA